MSSMSYTDWLRNASITSLQRMIAVLGALQESALPTARSRVYIYDLIEQHTVCSSCSLATMLGYNTDEIELMGKTGFADLIHPHDLERVADHYQQFTTLTDGEVLEVEYRMRRTDGTWGWLRSQETPFVQARSGFPLQILGLVQDITAFKQAGNPRKKDLAESRTVLHLVTSQTVLEYRQVLEEFTNLSSSHAS